MKEVSGVSIEWYLLNHKLLAESGKTKAEAVPVTDEST